ncbi:PREDICTED: leukemia inhibitory factor receptor [Nanorana parkeri]|uniref:leukemia inhibitory factor receptor n=1 Tax=Nanorana parkeri TaxID=125878 RepID=UPI000855064F|nr:PREDICTED: leukemia inhibitory factor receptor [Nanorana parkeri]
MNNRGALFALLEQHITSLAVDTASTVLVSGSLESLEESDVENFPEFYRNLTCVTHDLDAMSCKWETPDSAGSAVLYEVCLWPSEQERCYDSHSNSLQVELQLFSTMQVRIKAKNVSGEPVISFMTTAQEIPYVPYTPQILSLVGDYKSDVLLVNWTVNFTGFLNTVTIEWEINVLRGENLQLVKNETFVVHWNLSMTTFHWNWTSDFPLNCTSHSVRIRCLVHDEYYPGEIRHSEWSVLKTIDGDTSLDEPMFPVDKVLLVGSNMTVCCKLENVMSIEFNTTKYPVIELGSPNVGGIRLFNMNKSEPSGDNIVCYSQSPENMAGTVVFVGYPPADPQDFNCEARDLTIINCTWKTGRPTGLYGERGTKYTLYERFSGINLTCSGYTGDQEDYNCSVDVKKGKNLYEFLLLATNPLGAANISLDLDIREKIYPFPVERISINDLTPTEVSVSWILPGAYTSVDLLCETEIRKTHGEVERRNITLKGADRTYYNYPLNNLHPFTSYNFRVRCSSHDHFWKWSNWSKAVNHKALAAAPSRKLDIWAERIHTLEGFSIAVYWKHLKLYEANGDVTSYSIEWKPLHSNQRPQSVRRSGEFNRTQINLPAVDNGDYEINVTAINSAGSSPPSSMTTVQLSSEDVEIERAVGDSSGINITWNPDSNFSCGYAVKWVPSFHLQGADLQWKRFSSHRTSAFIHTQQIQAGVRHNISLYGCRENKFQLLKSLIAYTEELPPKVSPNFTVQETTSNSILVKWEPIPEDNLCGFLQGYLVYVVKNQSDSYFAKFRDLARHSETKMKNITDLAVRVLKIEDLQSGTNYQLGLQAYTRGGQGPIRSFSVVTNDNALGLILAILIPIVVAVVLGIVTIAICYHKREWIKETFYPDIPNPENSKALQFQNNISEGTKTIKTLEMNPCTPNSVEVVESFYTVPKILDTELNSPMSESGQLPEDGSEAPDDDHIVVSYCQPTSHGDISNPVLDESATPSQVVYIDVQSMYQPQVNSEEEPESDFLDSSGYKPQMQLPISSVTMDSHEPAEDTLVECAGYRPQGHPNTWAVDSPGSPTSIGSENASFGSPCSVNSRHFLIPPVDNKDSLKPTHIGWSISSLFQNKQDD